jgi:hypothetical protein
MSFLYVNFMKSFFLNDTKFFYRNATYQNNGIQTFKIIALRWKIVLHLVSLKFRFYAKKKMRFCVTLFLCAAKLEYT